MRKIVSLILILLLSTSSVFAISGEELQGKLEALEQSIDVEIASAKTNIKANAYPIGSVYKTRANLTESDIEAMFGGDWEEIHDVFLWGTRNGVGETGGSATHRLIAHLSLGPVGLTSASSLTIGMQSGNIIYELLTGSIPIVEGSSDEIEIMPPYLVVKMFRRVA